MSKRLVVLELAFGLFIFACSQVWAGGWEGFYAGGNFGTAFSYTEMKSSTVYDASGYLSQGDVQAVNAGGDLKAQTVDMTYSLHGGYNLELGGGLVGGLQADLGAMSQKTEVTTVASLVSDPSKSFSVNQGVATSWTVMVRPRVGLDVSGLLLYGTAGLSLTELSFQSNYYDSLGNARESGGNDQYANNPTDNSILAGLVFGLGAEFKLSNELSLNSEWLFMDYGKMSSTSANLSDGTTTYSKNVFTNSADPTVSVFQMGLNYHL